MISNWFFNRYKARLQKMIAREVAVQMHAQQQASIEEQRASIAARRGQIGGTLANLLAETKKQTQVLEGQASADQDTKQWADLARIVGHELQGQAKADFLRVVSG